MSIMMVLSQWNPKRNIPLFTMPSHVPFTQSSPLVPLSNSQFSPASDSKPSPPSSHASSNPADEPFSPAVSPKIPVVVEVPYPWTRSKLKRLNCRQSIHRHHTHRNHHSSLEKSAKKPVWRDLVPGKMVSYLSWDLIPQFRNVFLMCFACGFFSFVNACANRWISSTQTKNTLKFRYGGISQKNLGKSVTIERVRTKFMTVSSTPPFTSHVSCLWLPLLWQCCPKSPSKLQLFENIVSQNPVRAHLTKKSW